MLSSGILDQITQLVLPILERESLRLYDLEVLTESGRRILRVYISKLQAQAQGEGEKDSFVSVDDCYRVSQALSLQLDVEDLIPFTYDLEVSSPGLERKLKQDWHFLEALGETMKVTLDVAREFEGFGSKKFRTFEAQLVSMEEGLCHFLYEDQPLIVSRAFIEKAKIVFTFGRDKDSVLKHPMKSKGKEALKSHLEDSLKGNQKSHLKNCSKNKKKGH
jgi:ribosome maturation factor RimP